MRAVAASVLLLLGAAALGAAWLIASEVWYHPRLFWEGMLFAGVASVIATGAIAAFVCVVWRIE